MINIKFDTSSFDRKLKELKRTLDKLGEKQEVPLNELLPNSFINKHTKFQSLQAMVDASGIKNPEELKGEPFSKFVSAHSNFGNWEEMLEKAGAEYIKRKLGL